MRNIVYLEGDATDPISHEDYENRIIMHCVNDIGAWGAGFVLALDKKWPNVRDQYLLWHQGKCKSTTFLDSEHETKFLPLNKFALGEVQFVQAMWPDIFVANMVGQHGVISRSNPHPIRYDAFEKGFKKIARVAFDLNALVVAPMLGAGLAGGDFNKIESLIQKHLVDEGIDVIIYKFKGK